MDSILIDPLQREILLSDATWFGHIVKGHPELARKRFLVEHALRQPVEIQKSTSDTNCRLYYSAPNKAGLMIVVVADVVIKVVKTAYSAVKKKKGDIEWTPP
jgi:hypothetical protein